MKKRRLLQVTWIDSCSIDGAGTWKDIDRVAGMAPCRVESVGWVIAEHSDFITLAASVDRDDHASGEICIPKGCIVRKRLLR